ncbi:MAG: hypothetical protein ACFB21_12295 [Opitutales bacterium]
MPKTKDLRYCNDEVVHLIRKRIAEGESAVTLQAIKDAGDPLFSNYRGLLQELWQARENIDGTITLSSDRRLTLLEEVNAHKDKVRICNLAKHVLGIDLSEELKTQGEIRFEESGNGKNASDGQLVSQSSIAAYPVRIHEQEDSVSSDETSTLLPQILDLLRTRSNEGASVSDDDAIDVLKKSGQLWRSTSRSYLAACLVGGAATYYARLIFSMSPSAESVERQAQFRAALAGFFGEEATATKAQEMLLFRMTKTFERCMAVYLDLEPEGPGISASLEFYQRAVGGIPAFTNAYFNGGLSAEQMGQLRGVHYLPVPLPSIPEHSEKGPKAPSVKAATTLLTTPPEEFLAKFDKMKRKKKEEYVGVAVSGLASLSEFCSTADIELLQTHEANLEMAGKRIQQRLKQIRKLSKKNDSTGTLPKTSTEDAPGEPLTDEQGLGSAVADGTPVSNNS